MKQFVLVLMLVVFCRAESKQAEPKAKSGGGNKGDNSEGPNPNSVGTCRPEILEKRNKSFNIDEIANTGYYKYWYLTGNENVACASAEIHGDKDNGYFGSARLTDANEKTTTIVYSLKVLQPGIIEETFNGVDKNGKPVTNKYKLVVLYWNPENGVFEYLRCGDAGTSTTDSRAIVVRDCNNDPSSVAFTLADALYDLDYLFNLKGHLHAIDICVQ